jgi:hypothetical protein
MSQKSSLTTPKADFSSESDRIALLLLVAVGDLVQPYEHKNSEA